MHYLDYNEKKQHGTLDFPIEYYHVDKHHPRYNMPFHCHKELEIIRILEGILYLKLDDEEFEAKAGDIIFINEGVIHGGLPHNCIYECIVFEMYYVELATGLRRGELLGLKWEDIDLEKGNLRVKRQIARIDGKVVEAPLKTKNAYRTLPLAEDTIAVLKQQKKKTGSSPWVFPSPTGGPISPDSVLHMLHRVLKRAGLPRVRFHDLRHTFATLALQNGVDIKTVSGMLGHFSAGFTLGTYAHVTTAAQKEAAKAMERVLTAAL